ncbi:MAG TPA: histidine phosphatase family protein [Candidatus Bilamarchaeum sp.]|nr:histidine phosphatase family protein [Candidatus Bilamarchaeum sp.]
MTTVYIIRHAQSVANEEGYYNCVVKEDQGLTALGKKQAWELANQFSARPLSRIYVSPFLRTRQTAAELSKTTKAELEIVDEFRELDCGAWSGRGEEYIRKNFEDAWKGWHYDPQNNPIPGGETLLEVQARALPKFEKILKKHSGESIAIVTHYCVMNVLLCSLVSSLGNFRSFKSRNCAVAEIAMENVPKLISFRQLPD